MKSKRIEDPFFFMKGGFLYYTVLAVVLFLSGSLLFIADRADAARSERLSFASNRTGNFDIYVIGIDGEHLRNVTNHPTDEFGPWAPIGLPVHTWSPDGRFLAYVSRRDGDFKVYVMDTRTKEHWPLTHQHETEWLPAWSPDGKWIAFVSGNNHNIYKTDVNGARLVQLTDFGGNGQPAWSPDGKQIAFTLHIRDAQREHLCVIDVNGKNFRQLTQGGPILKPVMVGKQPPRRFPLPQVGSPAWSPDGKWIAYVYSDTMRWQNADIYIIDAEENGRGKPLVKGVRQDLSPAWVPEGFLFVSPSAEKQTVLWGRLKQETD